MKYIRTKDGRIITLKDELVDNVELWVLGGKENIIKIANTIEELCDEFVFGNVIVSLKEAKQDHKVGNVYGAIWTDKGLIYVAKMNKKGELELL